MSEASDIRELTVLVFMTCSLAGTVAATPTSGPPYALLHVSIPDQRSGRYIVGTLASAAGSLQCVCIAVRLQFVCCLRTWSTHVTDPNADSDSCN